MNMNQYQALAMNTAKDMGPSGDLLHAALGVTGEAGEFADAVKKHYVYGRALDRDNAIEEVGDLLWFCALACRALETTMGEVAQANIEKLAKRYPERYSDVHASLRLDKLEPAAEAEARTAECGRCGRVLPVVEAA